jgi:Ser/Thr protein kinase RdoA (MazF antagonist)
MLKKILTLYGIDADENHIKLFGDGLINRTWKVSIGSAAYILQKVNDAVFKKPIDIDHNVSAIREFLNNHYPDYKFISPLPSTSGETLITTPSGYYRLFPFVSDSHSLNVLDKEVEAFEAAKQFGKFTRVLNDYDVKELKVTLPNFHNLSMWYNNFTIACENAAADRKQKASGCISFIKENAAIVSVYEKIINEKAIPERVIHHDTKINNVLFDEDNKGLCVIDLDTVMPGYFISDVGDMMRTYLCAVSEEETDLNQINIRKSFFKAIYDGYLMEMGDVLTATEKSYFIYAGKFMIFMQGIRFLTDYLQNDIYYGRQYEDQNFKRAENQLTLLKRYLEIEDQLKELIA